MKLRWKLLPAGLAIIVAVLLAGQWRTRIELQGELAGLRARQAEVAELRVENQRLASLQVSAEELENLRADHAAIVRMREELNALKEQERAAAGPNP